MSGGALFLGSKCIDYFSSKQTCKAQSTSEAEYIVMSEMCKVVRHYISVSQEFGMELDIPVLVYCKTIPALVSEEAYSKLPKHIDVRYNQCCDMVRYDIFKTAYVPSESNIADILTKPLYISTPHKHCMSLGLEVCDECRSQSFSMYLITYPNPCL